ncbi:sodium-translocating pyrophosphatase [Propionibacteriaceae bacterium Y1923]|uniref:sodium-translocating pyrophosphatase n=1 Tax=Aestuariimicrobium sp. Y1814 TaxID=3418742 RepID=UPI003C246B3D
MLVPLELALSANSVTIVIVIAALAAIAVAMSLVYRGEVLRAADGTENMKSIALAVQEGASAYLGRQFRTLGIFAVIAFLGLLALPIHGDGNPWVLRIARSVAFLGGAGFSALIGYLGMWLAVRANVRVAAAARDTGREPAMKIAFRTGAAVGMATIGLGLLGAALVVLAFGGSAPVILEGFGFGAALLAMFMRVGGGIFTKAADVGADLVGKVEQNIPEDDPRNAATIADNVGDNVGDCAGMAADLFESYAVTLVAALILGRAAFGEHGLVFPLIIPAIGVLTALAGVYLMRPKASENGLTTINRAFYASAAISLVLSGVASFTYLPSSFAELGMTDFSGPVDDPRLVTFGAVAIGIALAAVILALTGYYTGTEHKPVQGVGKTSLTGAATVVLSGIALGLESAVFTALLIALAVLGAFSLGGAGVVGLFAIALAGCGLLTTVGVIVAMDTFGPVSDNAQGIAEMSGDVDGDGAQILTELDAVGNTTKAITKGIAIATAVLAATALFGAFTDSVAGVLQDRYADFELQSVVFSPAVLVGLLVGAAVVFLFSGQAIRAVGRAAGAVVVEVRRQFREIPGIMEGTGRPEYSKVVDICTRDSLRELSTPGLLAITAPIVVGFSLGAPALAGFLAGAIAAGTLMAVFLANSGGSWDNAKKLVEDGHHGGKGSPAHEATVIGDTVGDPFKDTAGPAINPLLKVMNLVALLIAPAAVGMSALGESPNLLRYLIAGVALVIAVVMIIFSSRTGSTVLAEDEPNPGLDGLPGNPEWEATRHAADRTGPLAEIEAEVEAATEKSHAEVDQA